MPGFFSCCGRGSRSLELGLMGAWMPEVYPSSGMGCGAKVEPGQVGISASSRAPASLSLPLPTLSLPPPVPAASEAGPFCPHRVTGALMGSRGCQVKRATRQV